MMNMSPSPHRPEGNKNSNHKAAAPGLNGEILKPRANASAVNPATPHPIIENVEGNLLDQKVEVIVNSWNRNTFPYWMLYTQGVSGAIKKAAGTGPFKEVQKGGKIAWGGARLTTAGNLGFKGIIHVAGLNHAWLSSEWSVRECVRNALVIAKREGFRSIAFPAIGAGSSIKITSELELPIWGLSTKRSLQIINDEAAKSDYDGRIIIVKFKKIR